MSSLAGYGILCVRARIRKTTKIGEAHNVPNATIRETERGESLLVTSLITAGSMSTIKTSAGTLG
jgi:hypothetical protein